MRRFRRGTRLDEHFHAWGCLHWIRRGLYHERDAARTYRCGAGTILYKPPAVVHENRFDDDAWALRLQIPWHMLPEPAREPSSSTIHVLTPVAAPLLAAVWAEHQIADGPSELAVAALTTELVTHVIGGAATERSRSARAAGAAQRAISERWNESISFAELADQTGVDRATLSRSFRHRFGLSMGAFQRRFRVARALGMLDDGASVTVAAYETGFADHAHFTRAFKAVVGVAPVQWRRLAGPLTDAPR